MKQPETSIKKIVIIGPESTGKSVLAERLAAHYNSLWVPEYARQFLEVHGMNYTYTDLLTIAKGQLKLEDDLVDQSKNPLIFIDTNMYVMKFWCEVVFGKCHSLIEDEISRRHYDLYLLCNVDLPWVKAALREYPELEKRQALFSRYEELLKAQKVPWELISGNYDEQFNKAVHAIEKYFPSEDKKVL